MKILINILNFLSKNKKNIFYILMFSVFLFCVNDFVLASDPTSKTEQTKSSNSIIEALNLFLWMVGSILALITMLIWVFLTPEWTSGSVIWLDTQLKTMWIMISNVVYFIFAWIFVTIAFMNIVWWWDNYELKKALPKFIVWVLIVPFSWFFVQFILSLSSILTVAVLSLPYDSFPDMKIWEEKMSICSEWYKINLSATWTNIISCNWWWKSEQKSLNEIIKDKDNSWLYHIMMIYTYWVMKLDAKWKLFSDELVKWITDITKLSAKAVFDLIFLIVYLILLVALFLAFMTRWIALWFYMMFSPVFWLLHYFWKWKEWVWEWVSKKFNIHEFIALAFVPVYVAWALTFWLIFLYTAWKWLSASSSSVDANKIMKIEWWQLKIQWWVPLTFDAVITKWPENQVSEIFKWFSWVIWTMILQLLWLAVLWVAVMAALKQSSVTANVTQPISEFWDQIWKLIAKSPTYAPILPWWISAEWLKRIWTMPINAIEKDLAKRISPFQEKIDWLFWVKTIPETEINNIKWMFRDWIKSDGELKEIQWLLQTMAEKYWTNNSQFQNLVKEFNEVLKDNKSDSNLRNFWKDSAKLFDSSWKLTQDWVDLLFNNTENNNLGKSRLDWAAKVWNPQQWKWHIQTPNTISSTIPSKINVNKSEKEWWATVFNIYWVNDDKKTWSKIDITVNKDWTYSWDIVKALESYKNKTIDELKWILKWLWIKDEYIDELILKIKK